MCATVEPSVPDGSVFRSVPALIEQQVDRDPARPAMCYLDRTLSYGELDRLANGLAATLAEVGVRDGDLVPVLLVNSLELPVTYLALMKLGAAFVPFDPAWPAERIHTALGGLAPGTVLCADREPVPAGYRHLAHPVDVDRIAPTPLRPGVAVGPDDPIYGIFTSGTTGPAKCAVNRHAGLTNRFRFMSRYFAATGGEVVLQNSKHTFDSSVWQLFWPLTTGGRCVVPAQGEFLNLQHSIDTIARHGITITDFVPSVFNAMVSIVDSDPAARGKLTSLRHLVVGGEEITPPMVHRLMALLPQLRVTNGYGPTEASIGMIFHLVDPSDGDVIPLGRPIDNCYAVVTDDELRPLPPGELGQIVIGGACLGLGYYGDPARTAELFVDNPFPHVPGERVYLTGDLGYADADGRLFFAGRKDFQVKIGGVRIELGEIEAAAESCPGVRQAKALVARHGGAKSLALFACGDGRLTEDGLRAHLRTKLARTTLPRHCFVLSELPLTEHGKVDRRRLQTMLDRTLTDDVARLAGADRPADLPAQVLHVFRSVLGQPGLAPGADFLSAGGDSLQALSAAVWLSSECTLDIGVQDLFDHPSAAGLAAFIEARQRTGTATEPEASLLERDATAPVPAVPGRSVRDPQRILVTGATGFVGRRLVYELLTRTGLTVVCLVRAADDAAALDRVTNALTAGGLWQPPFSGRLEAYAGDLSRPALGLPDQVWQHLARTVDLVLHNGALVNFLFDYRVHRLANVLGTAEMLRLAMAHHVKPLHHISTLGVLDGEARRQTNPLSERFELTCGEVPVSGYSRSKWVAERYLARARAEGAVVTVYRLGEVMPSADNGNPNPQALTHLLLSAFHRLGISPTAAIRSDYTPVDYAAQRIVAGVGDRAALGRTLHVFHPESVCYADVLSRVGTAISRVSCSTFRARVAEAAAETGDRDLAALLAFLPEGDEERVALALSGLLVDNPRLFRKDECVGLEVRARLTDGWLYAPIAAYRDHLKHRHAGVGALATN
jgi:amino acid adenylation domain-containing protein/thioester reductase-like protein